MIQLHGTLGFASGIRSNTCTSSLLSETHKSTVVVSSHENRHTPGLSPQLHPGIRPRHFRFVEHCTIHCWYAMAQSIKWPGRLFPGSGSALSKRSP